MDYRDKLAEERRGLRALVARIPGFRGYSDKELRREADMLLRTHLARGFDEQSKRLAEVQACLTKARQLSAVGEVERVVVKLQRLVDRLKTASYGYAGWFDAVAVETEDLDHLYQYDYTLVSGLEELMARVDALSGKVHEVDEAVSLAEELAAFVEQLNLALDRRRQVLYED